MLTSSYQEELKTEVVNIFLFLSCLTYYDPPLVHPFSGHPAYSGAHTKHPSRKCDPY